MLRRRPPHRVNWSLHEAELQDQIGDGSLLELPSPVLAGPSRSGGSSYGNAGKVVEALVVARNNGPSGGACGCGDDQVMGTSGATAPAHGHHQRAMGSGTAEVVAQDRKTRDQLVEERSPRRAAFAGGDLDSDAEFGDRDRGDRGLVVVGNQSVEIDG